MLDFTGGSFERDLSTQKSYHNRNLVAAGLSPALRKLLIRPQEDDDDKFMNAKKLLRETLNLTLAAMWNGYVEGNPNSEEYKLSLLDNALFRRYGLTNVDTMEELMKGLNIDEWQEQDFMNTLTPIQELEVKRRKGVLIIDTLAEGKQSYCDDGKIDLLFDPSVGEIYCDVRRKYLLNNPVRAYSIATVKEVLNTDSLVDKLIEESVKITGVPTELSLNKPVCTPKRKTISPPTQGQVARALKFQRAGDQGSPILRVRSGMDTLHETPPGLGNLASPAFEESRRKITIPKQSYTPDMKQTLITSVFSPKIMRQPEEKRDL